MYEVSKSGKYQYIRVDMDKVKSILKKVAIGAAIVIATIVINTPTKTVTSKVDRNLGNGQYGTFEIVHTVNAFGMDVTKPEETMVGYVRY